MRTMTSSDLPGKLWRSIRARPLLASCTVLGLVTALLIPAALTEHTMTRVIIGWNVGSVLYLVATARLMYTSTRERMHSRAVAHDDGRVAVLTLVVLAALVALGAIINQLAVARQMQGELREQHVVLAAFTLLTSWTFTQVMFALHYAHDYYAAQARNESGGLDFPGEKTPDYLDFLYFSCVIGTSGQTADVNFTSRTQRRTGLVHCILAFFFNATLLALTINIASGLV